MRKRYLILLCFFYISSITFVTAQEDMSIMVDLYLVKETVEITTDWTDLSWDTSIPVFASKYEVIEGEGSIVGIEVAGLDLWVAKEGFDSTKVIVEIEAIIGKTPTTVSLHVEKGDIESTNIIMSAMEETGEYRWITSRNSQGRGPFYHSVDLSEACTYSPGKSITQETVQDLRGKVYAFYYPWYGNLKGPSQEPFHWDYYTNEYIQTSTDYPLFGPYDSYDPRIIRAHIALAQQAGIDGFIASWWGPNSFEDKALTTILDIAEEMDFEASAYYESVRTMTQQQVTSEMEYLIDNYGDQPAFLHESGEPVVFVYVPSYKNRDVEFWLQVRETVENQHGPITLIADHGDRDLFPAFEAFHMYIYTGAQSYIVFSEAQQRIDIGFTGSAEENINSLKDGENLLLYKKPFFVTVNPGFWFYRKGPGDLLAERDNGEKYADNWDTALELDAHTVLITSWNEWHEGTEIEPSREHGFEYLGYTRDYIEQYKETEESINTPIISLNILSEPGSQHDIVQITASNAPIVAVNVSIKGVVSGSTLTGDFISYLEEYHEFGGWIQIPFIGAEETINITVTHGSEISTGYNVDVNGYDTTGNICRVTGKRAPPILTRLTCSVDNDYIEIGDEISITGSLTPVISDALIEIQVTDPTQEVSIIEVHTDSDGLFSYNFQALEPGQWKLKAEYYGDLTYYGNSSETMIQVNIVKDSFPLNTTILAMLMVALIFIIIILVSKIMKD